MSRRRLSGWAYAARKPSGSPKPKSFTLQSATTASPFQSIHEKTGLRHRCDELHLSCLSRIARQHYLTQRNVDECSVGLPSDAASHHSRTAAGAYGRGFREGNIIPEQDVRRIQSESETAAQRTGSAIRLLPQGHRGDRRGMYLAGRLRG